MLFVFKVRVSNEARELIVVCCNEFIHLVSSEANDICNKNTKKTIMPEHVLQGSNLVNIVKFCLCFTYFFKPKLKLIFLS